MYNGLTKPGAVAIGMGLALSGCAGAEQQPDTSARQPYSNCEARRSGQDVEVIVKLGDTAMTKLNRNMRVDITTGLGPQSKLVRSGVADGASRIVVFEDLPATAEVSDISLTNVSVDDDALGNGTVPCVANEVLGGKTLNGDNILPASGK